MKTERYRAIRAAVADMHDEQAEETAEQARREAEWNEWEAEYAADCAEQEKWRRIDGWRGVVYEDPDQIIDDIDPDPWFDEDADWRSRDVFV